MCPYCGSEDLTKAPTEGKYPEARVVTPSGEGVIALVGWLCRSCKGVFLTDLVEPASRIAHVTGTAVQHDSQMTISVASSAENLEDADMLSLSIENTAGAYDLELLDDDNNELAWTFEGPDTRAERIRSAVAEVADHYGVTLRIVYTDASTLSNEQTVFYVGRKADLEYAAGSHQGYCVARRRSDVSCQRAWPSAAGGDGYARWHRI